VLLSRMSDRVVQRWVQVHEFAGFSGVTTTDRQAFLAQIATARRTDHWIAQQQLDSTLGGVALPLVDRHGTCKAALSMTLQVQSWPTAAMEEKLLPALRETALTLIPLL
jgi:IclR family pca regulon transcriptional regulator